MIGSLDVGQVVNPEPVVDILVPRLLYIEVVVVILTSYMVLPLKMNGLIDSFSLMKRTCATLLFALLCWSVVIEVARGDDDGHRLDRDKDNSQVRWWKIVYGGLIDTIKRRVSSRFSYEISPEARMASVRTSYQLCLFFTKYNPISYS